MRPPRPEETDPVLRAVNEVRGFVRVVGYATIGLFLVLIIAFATALSLRGNDLQAQTRRNHALIVGLQHNAADLAKNRAEFRARTKRTAVLACRDIETLKAGFRQQALDNFKNLNRNLRILGLKRTDEVVKLAGDGLQEALHRYAARKGGCGTLPIVRP